MTHKEFCCWLEGFFMLAAIEDKVASTIVEWRSVVRG